VRSLLLFSPLRGEKEDAAPPFSTASLRRVAFVIAIRHHAAFRIRASAGEREAGSNAMSITISHLAPVVALIAGILILLVPRLLNYIVAIYLIVIGIIGLGVFR
jgi:hypothetical protein